MSTFINGRNSFGSIFSYSSIGSSGTFNDMAAVMSITVPSYSRSAIDITNQGTTDYFEQAISGGIIRSGNIGFTAVYLSTVTAQVTTIPTDFIAGTRSGFKITVAGTSSYNVWYGDFYITGYSPMTLPGMEGLVGFEMTGKVTGKPTIAASTGS